MGIGMGMIFLYTIQGEFRRGYSGLYTYYTVMSNRVVLSGCGFLL